MPHQCKPLPPASDLWEWYSYNPLTGELFSRRRNRSKSLGSTTHSGYVVLMNQGRQLYMHRVIWKWVTGADANETLDHKNQIRDDNRFENLAPASFLEQARNRSSVVLNPDKVRQIRARLSNGERPGQIHADFGCSRETIVAVQKNRIWKDVA